MKTVSSDSGILPPSGFGRFNRGTFFRVLCTLVLAAAVGFAGAVKPGGQREVKTYIANLYVGSDLMGALTVNPTNLPAVIETVTGIYLKIVKSDPATRMAGIASRIAAEQPDLVGLVEVFSLYKAPLTGQGPGEFETVADFLASLQQALAAQGAYYRVASVSTEADITMPMMDLATGGLALARLVDHDVILVKEGLPPGFLKTSNPQSGHFEYIIRLPDAGIEVTRGWCSVDVFSRGENFRFICSHLETEAVPQLQYAQAMELLAGPANTRLPVILVGDFNTDPLGRDGTFTYPLFGQAGFQDSWLQLNPDDPEGGLTWGHDELLADPTDAFETRIDLILYRGGNFVPASAVVIDAALDRSSPPLWGSDHAALSVNFSVSVPQSRRAEKAMAE